MSYPSQDCSCNGGIIYNVAQCKACNSPSCPSTGACADITQKRIQNTVRVPESEYAMNLGALNVYQRPSTTHACVNWNQMSDRRNAHTIVNNNVPTRGNSTKSSITRMRPGSTSAPGSGVDVKHDSYARYLARLKGKSALRTQNATGLTPLHGNKTKKFGIVKSAGTPGNCLCFTNTCV